VVRLDQERALVQTVDFFPPIVDDPIWFGRIAAANALSDVFAMGGTALAAMNLVAWPTDLDVTFLGEVMVGGQEKIIEAGAVLCGGHSVTAKSILYGLAVTGEVHPDRFWRNSGAQDGDVVLLTKPLGIGIVCTAIKKGLAEAETTAAALEQMATLNLAAAAAVADLTVHGATDVTGFGIMGHGRERADGAGLTLEIDSASVPVFPGSLQVARDGLLSGGARRGRANMEGAYSADGVDPLLLDLMFDAETSGGLLLALPGSQASVAQRRLADRGVSAVAVGTFRPKDRVSVRVR
jgi:selenide,water dikinase